LIRDFTQFHHLKELASAVTGRAFAPEKKGECMDGLDVIVAGFPLLLFG
jgi:hypothetical protein